MSDRDAFLSALAESPADERADFIGHLVFRVMDDPDVDALEPAMRADLDHFIELVGFEEEDDETATVDRMEKYFAARPLSERLVRLFDALSRGLAAESAGTSTAQASEFLGQGKANVPVGGERKPGTMAGGLQGLVQARTGAIPVKPVTQTEPQQDLPPRPKPGSR